MEKEFRNCYSEDCFDCPRYEECQIDGTFGEDLDDDRDSWDMELQEQQDFAQDDYFDNMPGCGFYEDDIMGYDDY